jgi:hypothetical protein
MATTVDRPQWDLALETAKQNLDAAVIAQQKAQVKLATAQLAFKQATDAKIDAGEALTTLKQAHRVMFGETGG